MLGSLFILVDPGVTPATKMAKVPYLMAKVYQSTFVRHSDCHFQPHPTSLTFSSFYVSLLEVHNYVPEQRIGGIFFYDMCWR